MPSPSNPDTAYTMSTSYATIMPPTTSPSGIGIRNTETADLARQPDPIYVGIDLSYSSTGVVILDNGSVKAHTCKAGEPNQELAIRAKSLWDQLSRLLPKPATARVALEGASYASEFNAFMLGELAGAVKVYLHTSGYKVELIPPTVLKKFATGKGNSSKEYVAACVAMRWGFTHPAHDAVDAYVLARYIEARDKEVSNGDPGAQVINKPKKKRKSKGE